MEWLLQGLEPGNKGGIPETVPADIKDPVSLFEVGLPITNIVTPLQSPERPVEIPVGSKGKEAVDVSVVAHIRSSLINTKLADQQQRGRR